MTRFECIKETGDVTQTLMELKEILAEKMQDSVEDLLSNEFNHARIDKEAEERLGALYMDTPDELGGFTPESLTEFILGVAEIYAAACFQVMFKQTILDYLNEEV